MIKDGDKGCNHNIISIRKFKFKFYIEKKEKYESIESLSFFEYS